jgi:glycosyltransferase involved in cell wall biosynthesis
LIWNHTLIDNLKGKTMLTITWVTNRFAPYRRPIWSHLAASARLRVYLLESSPRDVERANRGPDWKVTADSKQSYGPHLPKVINLGWAKLRLPILVTPQRLVEGADVLVLGGWQNPAYWQLLGLARLRKRAVIGFYGSTLASNRFKRGLVATARRFFFRHLDLIVAPGPSARAALLAFGVHPSRIVEGFNTVDVESIHRAALQARAELSEDLDVSKKIIYVGQLIPRKNVDSLIRAMASFDPSYSLTILGEGSERERLKRLAIDLAVSDRITFKDYADNRTVPSLLCQHSTLVLPSTEEVWGLVVNEALACGLHVVVSTACGAASSVSGMRGVWLSGTSSESIAEQIQKSSKNWTGPIAYPEILQYTPEALADKFLEGSRTLVGSDLK